MSGPFDRVLLATESGEYDAGAQTLAFSIAKRRGVRLACMVPVLSNPEFEAVAPQLAAKAEAEAADKVDALSAAAQVAGVDVDTSVRHGPEPYVEIVDEARKRRAELIVIRRRGRRGLLANLLIGEMVGRVVSHAPCSVLIVPRAARPWSKRVLVGIDPRAPDPATLELAAAIAADGQLALRVLCVATHEAERDDAARVLSTSLQQARERVASADGEVRLGRAHQVLIDAAREAGADLIVIGRHGGQMLGRAWFGGTAQKVIGLADCPVLIQIDSAATTGTNG